MEVARAAQVCIAVVGDRAGLFGRGTVGEGCDTDSLQLPGVQRQLVEALFDSGTPVVLVLVTGRPYAIGWAVNRAAAVVQAFFPGEEGAGAVAGVLSGRINPTGRLPVSMPRSAGAQPYTYRHPRLGGAVAVSTVDPAPVFPFGYGLSYTTFEHSDLRVTPTRPAVDGEIQVGCTVNNTGRYPGADVVQLYASDLTASVTRPLRTLIGWARVELNAGAAARVEFTVPADRLALVGLDLEWVVEPGEVVLTVAPSCAAPGLTQTVCLTGTPRTLRGDRLLLTGVRVLPG